MRRFFSGFLLFAVTTVFAANKSDKPAFDIEQILGSYRGQALNGNGMQVVDTNFLVGREGQLVGGYELHGPDKSFKGHLSNGIFETDRKISMEWTDKDGEGIAVFEFSRDYETFTGQWTDNKGGSGPWNGKKNGGIK